MTSELPKTRTVGHDILERLSYDPVSGVVSWKDGKKAGEAAGCLHRGYIQIGLAGAFVRAHHAAWLLMTGEFPPAGFDVDHINRDKGDNRWANLRLATRSQNKMNQVSRGSNAAPFRGVSWHVERQAWRVAVHKNGRKIYLGQFRDFDQAVSARIAGERKHFGEFAPR